MVVRRALVLTLSQLGTIVLCAQAVHGQTPPPQTPPAAQTAPGKAATPDVPAGPEEMFLAKTSPAIMLNLVRADKTADYEEAMKQVKAILAASDKPERRQQAEGWLVYRVTESGAAAGGQAVYVWYLSPAVVGASYDPGKIVYEGMKDPVKDRPAADALFKKLNEAYAQFYRWSLDKTIDMKGGGGR